MENDKEASIRESEEEIGAALDKCLYLGKLPKNFFVYWTRSGNLYVSVNIFFMYDIQDFKLNSSEVQAYKWIDWMKFINPGIENFAIKKNKVDIIIFYIKF